MDDSNLPSDSLDKVSLSVMASIGSKSATVSDAREDPLVDQYIQQGMMRANERALSRAQKVQVRSLLGCKSQHCVLRYLTVALTGHALVRAVLSGYFKLLSKMQCVLHAHFM